ncbi:hypothetical protein C2G38_2210202 [Gigaspora rosea]|uniref:PLAC8 family-domain-containing protein n=1 Tax=Gigaspora rosea TaxID=44941 RepID=A0A397UIA4_9GLOM|nr:hypothetical protein C2G38_2210202 [Gigaspora rosea]
MAYQGTQQMTPTGAQIVQEKSGGPGGPRQWEFGLCDCCSACGLCVNCIIGGMNRGDIRSRHNIQISTGSCLGDYCAHMCCAVCSLVQEHREVHEN